MATQREVVGYTVKIKTGPEGYRSLVGWDAVLPYDEAIALRDRARRNDGWLARAVPVYA